MLQTKTSQPKIVILSIDPAIVDGYDAYLESGYDESNLVFDETQIASRFNIQPLTRDQKDVCGSMSDRASPWLANCQAIRYTLIGLDGYQLNGEPSPDVQRRSRGRGDDEVTSSWWQEINFPRVIIEELSEHVSRISDPDPTL